MAQGRSLHIGLNYIDTNHYTNDGALNGCVYDAEDMQAIAEREHYETKVLLNEEATRQNVIAEITEAANTLVSGDIFFLTYSGHGGSVDDESGDETFDGKDETWCLFNGQLLDDELKNLWTKFAEGVRIFVISDSCHSGTVTKDALNQDIVYTDRAPRMLPSELTDRVFLKSADFYRDAMAALANDVSQGSTEIKATVLLISGCQDNQFSYDGDYNGAFTAQLKRVWGRGSFGGNYQQFHRQILSVMPAYQSPNYSVIGKSNPEFEAQVPFTI